MLSCYCQCKLSTLPNSSHATHHHHYHYDPPSALSNPPAPPASPEPLPRRTSPSPSPTSSRARCLRRPPPASRPRLAAQSAARAAQIAPNTGPGARRRHVPDRAQARPRVPLPPGRLGPGSPLQPRSSGVRQSAPATTETALRPGRTGTRAVRSAGDCGAGVARSRMGRSQRTTG